MKGLIGLTSNFDFIFLLREENLKLKQSYFVETTWVLRLIPIAFNSVRTGWISILVIYDQIKPCWQKPQLWCLEKKMTTAEYKSSFKFTLSYITNRLICKTTFKNYFYYLNKTNILISMQKNIEKAFYSFFSGKRGLIIFFF